MELVTGTGEILVVDERNPDLLDAARVSLGYLGVVFAFTLKVEPSYQLEQVTPSLSSAPNQQPINSSEEERTACSKSSSTCETLNLLQLAHVGLR